MLATGKRDHSQILAEIVLFCRKPQTKTRIMYETRLSYAQLKKCLPELRRCGLLEINYSQEKYVASEKGLFFLEKWQEMQEFLALGRKGPQIRFKSPVFIVKDTSC